MRCEATAANTTRAMLGHSQPTAPGTEAKNAADHELTVASSRNSKVWPYVRVPRVSFMRNSGLSSKSGRLEPTTSRPWMTSASAGLWGVHSCHGVMNATCRAARKPKPTCAQGSGITTGATGSAGYECTDCLTALQMHTQQVRLQGTPQIHYTLPTALPGTPRAP